MSNRSATPNARFGDELLKGFHAQFAENQRTREQSFLKIVGFLGAVVLGYAYVFQYITDEPNHAFSYATIAAVTLLLFGSFTVTVIAYNFRRDQFINARIRHRARVIGKGKPFPADYNPYHIFTEDQQEDEEWEEKKIRRAHFNWMPDIFKIFYLVFPVFQLLILFSYVTRQKPSISFCQNGPFETITICLSILLLLLSASAIFCFGRKLERKLRSWEREYSTYSQGK